MAQVASTRLDQMQDPEMSIEQAMTDYRRLGYSEAWLNGSWESGIMRVADGVARRVDRLRAIGNGQVPAVAAAAFLELKRRLEA